ncbi:MAG: glycosyltransferase family 2 protein [Candidatus Magasanikbacteria bacterium]|nr:glycosyltransferase family 2 protein [Candidatus Magasanikbacteria bacterium]
MKLSIIMVSWNTAEFTKKALASVFKETNGFEYEVIVVDNNSSDLSVSMIQKEFPLVRLIENKENVGFGKANNQGMLIAKGDYFFLLNTDTLISDSAITKLVNYLDLYPEVTCVGPRLLNTDGTFQHACRRNLPNPVSAFFHLFGFTKIFTKNRVVNTYKKYVDNPDITEPVEAISGAAMMFRRNVYEVIGGFDEDFFMYGEDLDFCKRVFDQGWKTVYVSESRITHFGGGSSNKRRTASLVNFYESMWIYYKKHFYSKANLILSCIIFAGIKVRMVVALIINMIKK